MYEQTKAIATKLEFKWLQVEFNSRTTPDKSSKYALESPLLKVKYMGAFNTRYPDKKTAMIEAFPLNTILNTASYFPSMESTATKIQTSKIQGYVTSWTRD
ncbi:RxLR effector family protein [Phytophthora palmivora]|uniref:RxLR effector family protein n=1 Tax=Phytophthora palmivora TaxID=4796 RepID=A0A2P4YBF8_9STRA|nr:RxLR effector family protein [Phytophthora palmivora]